MKVDERPVLPRELAEPASAGTRSDGSHERVLRAWQREMERAQAQSWFHGPLPAPVRDSASRSTSARLSDAPPAQSLGAVKILRPNAGAPLLGSSTPMASATLEATASNRPAGVAQPSARVTTTIGHADARLQGPDAASAISANAPSRPVRSDALLPAERGEQLSGAAVDQIHRTTAGHERGANALPVRVHLEEDESGVKVWLGVDAGAADDLPALQQAIGRWLVAAGYGATTWICNGRPLPPPPLRPLPDAPVASPLELGRHSTSPILARVQPLGDSA